MKRSVRDKNRREKKKRAVPFLPNFITTMSLFCGFYSIMFSLKGNYYMAAVLILIAGFIDGLDGRVARATNSTSEFGKQYDSLSDAIAFGVSPAIMAYLWKLSLYGRFGFIACFLFVACGALRLARFNIDTTQYTSFKGLPIPAAAATVAGIVLFSHEIGAVPSWTILVGIYILSFMMVSNIRFPSFKHIGYIKAHPFQLLVAGLLVLVVVALNPEVMIFVVSMTYLVGGIIYDSIRYLRERSREKKEIAETDHENLTKEDHHI